ncbi:MAG TPA: homoserine dehydrogenase, partial [Thermoplasmata archaeon]|nr:homoserine dehydrogenase [Thermoplasmata archaeon]
MKWRLAFIGFGTVGRGFAQILLEKKEMLKKRYGLDYSVVAVSDILKGSVYDANGLDVGRILDMVKAGKKLDEYPTGVKGLDVFT